MKVLSFTLKIMLWKLKICVSLSIPVVPCIFHPYFFITCVLMYCLQCFCFYHLRKMPSVVCDNLVNSPVYRMYQFKMYVNCLSNNDEWQHQFRTQWLWQSWSFVTKQLNELLADSDENDECLIRIQHSPWQKFNKKCATTILSLGVKFSDICRACDRA